RVNPTPVVAVQTIRTADVEPTLVLPTTVPLTPVKPTPVPSRPSVLLAERFATPVARWPNDPRGTAWFGTGEYRLFARDPGRFVAVGVPLPQAESEMKLSAQFHKTGGPAGGGYGFILRDQGSANDRDGHNQSGQYLVVEVGD